MKTFLLISAPIIYILIIVFSAVLSYRLGRSKSDIKPILAIIAGLLCCPLTGVLLLSDSLNVQVPPLLFPFVLIPIGAGFFFGIIYIWLAKVFLKSSSIATVLFFFGNVAGSAVCLYFYIFQSEVQDVLVSIAWGFLFGVFAYAMLFTGKSGGIQAAFGGLFDETRGRY